MPRCEGVVALRRLRWGLCLVSPPFPHPLTDNYTLHRSHPTSEEFWHLGQSHPTSETFGEFWDLDLTNLAGRRAWQHERRGL